MKALCIVNPCAGRGRGIKVWQKIKSQAEMLLPGLVVRFTSGPGHAALLAGEAAEHNQDMIIIIGGDGTVHEAVNGLAGSRIPIGIIPAGTGNDLAKTLGIPRDICKALSIIKKGVRRSIDLGRVDGRIFINMGGLGFDATVAHRVNKQRLIKGKAAYFWAIIRTIIDYKAVKVQITLDGTTWEETVTLIAIGNGEYVGGGVRMFPQANLHDGLLDICVIKKTTKLDMILTLPAIYKGRHRGHPKVSFYQGREVIITKAEPDQHIYTHVDGQEIDIWPICFQLHPGSLEILVPPPGE